MWVFLCMCGGSGVSRLLSMWVVCCDVLVGCIGLWLVVVDCGCVVGGGVGWWGCL